MTNFKDDWTSGEEWAITGPTGSNAFFTAFNEHTAAIDALEAETVAADDITDATTTGKAVLRAADAAAGRTAIGAGTASTKADVGLGNVDNTADTAKPVSTAQQTALDGKQNLDGTLTALAGVTTAANKLIYATGADTFATTDFTAAGRALLDDADAAAQRTTLSLDKARNTAGLGVSIVDYGATTGSADNHTAIQAAIDTVATAGGGVVYVPTGTWVTAPIALKSYVTLKGEGAYNSILKLKNSANAHFVTLSSGAVMWTGLQDIGFDGNKANQTSGDVLRLDNTGFDDTGPTMLQNSPNHYLLRVVVTNGKNNGVTIIGDTEGQSQLAFVFSYNNNGDAFLVSSPDNQLDHCIAASAGLGGFHIVGGNQSRLLGCKAFFNGLVDDTAGYGFQVDSGAKRVDMIHCEAQDNIGYGFVLVNTADGVIIGKSERNGLGASPYAGNAADGLFASGVTNSRIDLNISDRNIAGTLMHRRGYTLGTGNNGNIVTLTIGAVRSGTYGTGSWGANSVATIIYNSGTPIVLAPVSDATTTALALKAPIASPTFTGTVAGLSTLDTSLTLKDATDATKLAQFDVNSSQTTGTTRTFTLPPSSGQLATLANAEALTQKTIVLASNTMTGTTADFNTALTDNDFATLAGTESLTNKTLTNPTITNYTESVVAIGNTGTAKTIALTSGTVQTATLTGNCTFTMPTATAGKSFTLLLNTGAGSFTATFTGVKWSAGTAPTITTTAARLDILSFTSDGTNWYGSFTQNYTP